MKGINKGLSVLIVFGKWATPHIRWTKTSKGFCLGWFAITFHPCDMEDFMYKLNKLAEPNTYALDVLKEVKSAYCGVGDFEGTGQNMTAIIHHVNLAIEKSTK